MNLSLRAKLLIIFLISYVLFSANIGGTTIYILDEAKNSECAREMMESGDYIVPTFNYNLRTDKPPLHYYFMSFSYKIFGVNEFSARFFSAVFGALTLLITFIYVRRNLDEQTAWLTILVLWSAFYLTIQFHLAVPDPYLIFFLTIAFFSLYEGWKTASRLQLLIFYMAVGFAVLTKGPIGIGLPGLTALIFLLSTRTLSWQRLKSLHVFGGALLTLIIALPWYFLVYRETGGEWTREFLMSHNLSRFSSIREEHGGFFLMTFAYVVIGMFPFSVFLIQGFRKAWISRENKFLFFSLITSAVIILFFTISSTKLPNYTVPAFPFLAVMIAAFLKEECRVKNVRWSLVAFLILALAIPLGVYFSFEGDKWLQPVSGYAWYFLVFPAGGIAALIFYFRNNFHTWFGSVVISSMLGALIFLYIFYPAVDRENPVYKSMDLVQQDLPMAHYKHFNAGFSFYYQKPIPKLNTIEEVRGFLSEHPEAFVITRKKYGEDLKEINSLQLVREQKDIFEFPVTQIYRHQD